MTSLRAVGLPLILIASTAFAGGSKNPKENITKGTGVIVTLAGDREIEGVYLGRHDDAVWIGLDGGEIGLDAATVLKITPATTPGSEFLKRKAALAPRDVVGWWKLSQWAQGKELAAAARTAAETVVDLQPEHAEARAYLGYEKINGVWIDYAEGQRMRGMVEFEGEWMHRKQAEAIMTRREVAAGAKIAEYLRRRRERTPAAPHQPEDSGIHGHTEALAVLPGHDPMSVSHAIKRNDVKPLDTSKLRP